MSGIAQPTRGLSERAARVVDAVTRAWCDGEVDALDEVLAQDFVRHGQRSEMTRPQLKEAVRDMRRAFPDLTMEIVGVVEGETDLAIRWRSEGTLHDTYLGLPPTGRTYRVTGATFSTFEGDTISEEAVVYDRRGEYSSLGLPLLGSRGTSEVELVGPEALRSFHRRLVTGVTVVSTAGPGEPRGLAVNAFSSVSLEPPLVLICVQKSSSTYADLIASTHFGVNVLAADQLDVARVFATKQDRKFDLVDWRPGEFGVPLITGACAQLEVELQDTLHASTHTIFIGRVRAVIGSDAPPLVYADGGFFDGGDLRPAPGA